MTSTSKILEYEGPIHIMRRWCQDLMAYDFTPLHRTCNMMKDVDAMNRGPYHKIMNDYECMSQVMRQQDFASNPLACCDKTFNTIIAQGSYSLKKLPHHHTFCYCITSSANHIRLCQWIHRVHMHKTHTNDNMPNKASVFSNSTIADIVSRVLNTMTTNWVSLQPLIANLATRMMTRMGAGFDVTIIKATSELVSLSHMLCPNATVIQSSTNEFLGMLVSDKVVKWKEYTVTNDINQDITTKPIRKNNVMITGIDITLKIMLKPKLIHPLDPDFQKALRIVKHLTLNQSLICCDYLRRLYPVKLE